jgi:hypothetical protein
MFLIGAAILIQDINKALIAAHRLSTVIKLSKLDKERVDKRIV